MSEMHDKILSVGVITLLTLSGVMSIIFINYVKNILRKIDDVSHVGPLISKVEELVNKVEKIFVTLEVTRKTTSLEVAQLKERVAKLEDIVHKLHEERSH